MTPGGWLTDHLPMIEQLAAGRRRAVFLPFAGVTITWEEYCAKLQAALPAFSIEIVSPENIGDAELVIVGGGNTFRLLAETRKRGLLDPIRERVRAGARYLGWSAGSNLACPTIKTTNDMPVVDPGGLDALGLVRFQINPHYTNAHPPGHKGETRDERLNEFALMNPELPVIGVPEGSWIRVSGESAELGGLYDAVLFSGKDRTSLSRGRIRFPR